MRAIALQSIGVRGQQLLLGQSADGGDDRILVAVAGAAADKLALFRHVAAGRIIGVPTGGALHLFRQRAAKLPHLFAVRTEQDGEGDLFAFHFVFGWFGLYCLATPGTKCGISARVAPARRSAALSGGELRCCDLQFFLRHQTGGFALPVKGFAARRAGAVS